MADTERTLPVHLDLVTKDGKNKSLTINCKQREYTVWEQSKKKIAHNSKYALEYRKVISNSKQNISIRKTLLKTMRIMLCNMNPTI